MLKRSLLMLVALTLLFSTAVSANTITLNVLEIITSPERTALLKDLIAEYEALNPNIKINLISPPYEQADQKATLMLNTNQDLDVLEVRDYTVKQFVNNKKLTDLSPYFAGWSEAGTLSPVANASARIVDNTPYLVPHAIFIKALYVRTDVLAEYGITELPKTIEELVDICVQITDPARNQYGFAWRGRGPTMKFSDLFASVYVQETADAEFIYSEDEEFFLHPGYKEGLEEYIRLFKEGTPSDGVNWGFNEQVNGFVSGTTPFLIQDPDAIPLIDSMLGPDKYEVIPLPVGPYGFTLIDYGFSGWGIPSYSKHKEEAWDFISWITSAEKNGYFAEHWGPLPVHTTTFEINEHFQGKHYQAYAHEMANPDVYLLKTYPLASEKWPGWNATHETDVQSVLLGRISVDTLLQKWHDYWTK
jgi:multiple sugar transport system substrate-binding protein